MQPLTGTATQKDNYYYSDKNVSKFSQ